MDEFQNAFAERYEHGHGGLASRLEVSIERLEQTTFEDSLLESGETRPLGDVAAELRTIHQSLCRPYKLVVAGVQNAGKSTVVNVLVGRWLMPSKSRNVDAVLSQLTHASEEGATAVYRDGTTRPLTLAQAQSLVDQQPPSLADDPNGLERHHQEQALIDYVRFELEDENLRTFTFVNTPGLNDRQEVSKRTEDFFARADAILWVFDSRRVEELTITNAVLELCRTNGHKLIAVLNRADEVERMGGADAMTDVEDRFRQLFSGCYETVVRFNAKGAALGLGIHPAAHRRDERRLCELRRDSGLAELMLHFDANYFGQDKRQEKRRNSEVRARSLLQVADVRLVQHELELAERAAKRAEDDNALSRARRDAKQTQLRVNLALDDVAEQWIEKLMEEQLAAAEKVANEVIGPTALFRRSSAISKKFQAELDKEMERRYPHTLFLEGVAHAVEQTILQGWLDYSDRWDQEMSVEVDIDGALTRLGGDVVVAGPRGLGRAIAALLKAALRQALKVGGQRLARNGLKRVIQTAVRAAVKALAKILQKKFTLAFLRQLAKRLNPVLWLSVIGDANKMRQEMADTLAQARAEVRLEIGGQRMRLSEELCLQLHKVHAEICGPLIRALDEQLAAEGGEADADQARESAITVLRDELKRIWRDADSIGRVAEVGPDVPCSNEDTRMADWYEESGAE